MAKLFDSVKMRAPKRNKFDLSHERKMSFNMGDIVPILCEEIVPGDQFRVNTEIMMRLAPMLAPIMHRVNVKTEYFFVPKRLVWSESETFYTGGEDGLAAPIVPHVKVSKVGALVANFMETGTLWDYFGLPTLADAVVLDPSFADQMIDVTALRAYQTIWNEYYRDQNTQAKIVVPKTSGEVVGTDIGDLFTTRRRCWEKDYLTSCLPFAQRGPAVSIPLNSDVEAPTYGFRVGSSGEPFTEAGDLTLGADGKVLMTGSPSQDGAVHLGAEGYGMDVNALRRSVRLQEWLERAARVGSRYTELLRGFFGVRPSDQRLQRPEFLGGASSPISISEVLSTVQQVDPTSGDPIGNPQGDPTGKGISFGNMNGFSRFFEEHGWVIGVVSVLPRTAYQQGIHKKWQRFDKLDTYWEQFANIGEQAVRNVEAYYNGLDYVPGDTEATFGYQSRYAEYKYGCSTVHGDFRNTLAFWHMGRIFTTPPRLNNGFMECDPTHRIFAVEDPTVHKLWCQMYHRISALRPMPYFGTPTL
ncbi:MAG: major capsid protein [Microvirus sp.]|nr:MAG: major capsid protein [Microvirus sp.]